MLRIISHLFCTVGGVCGAAGVALGAALSHAFKDGYSAADIRVLEICADYLIWHALAICLCGLTLRTTHASRAFVLAGGLFASGIVLFCGGLSARVFTGIEGFAMLAPIGGSALIAGWLSLSSAGLVGLWRRS